MMTSKGLRIDPWSSPRSIVPQCVKKTFENHYMTLFQLSVLSVFESESDVCVQQPCMHDSWSNNLLFVSGQYDNFHARNLVQ